MTTTATAITAGSVVLVVCGFAANMTGTVEAAQYGPNLGWRFLVALPGYGPRWLGESFVEPFKG